jgi:hypothetical protein
MALYNLGREGGVAAALCSDIARYPGAVLSAAMLAL